MDKSLVFTLIFQILANGVWSAEVRQTIISSHPNDNHTHDVRNSTKQKHHSFYECPQWRLEPQDFVMTNGTAFVKAYNMTFNQSFYELEDGTLNICVPGWNSGNLQLSDSVDKYPVALAYVSVVGIGISIICLFLHLVVFVFFKQSRSLQDYNLAALCLSLLLGYSSFLVGHNDIVRLSGVPCVMAAAISHFFLLSSFLWMNTISYDILTALLNVAVRKKQTASAFRVRKFAMNCLYSWGISLLFVTIALTFDKIEKLPLEYRPLFDNGTCWFYHRKALLIFFAAPAFLLISMNIIFFGISTYIILKNRVKSDDEHRGLLKRNFSLYARLTIVMGLTWIVGALAGSVNSIVLWYIFVVLNTLQGLFIFLAFTCKRQNRDSLCRRWRSPFRPRTLKNQQSSVASLHGDRDDGDLDSETKKSAVDVF